MIKLAQYGTEKLTLQQAHTKCEELLKKFRSGQTALDVERLETHYGQTLSEMFDERFRFKSFYEERISEPSFKNPSHNCDSYDQWGINKQKVKLGNKEIKIEDESFALKSHSFQNSLTNSKDSI